LFCRFYLITYLINYIYMKSVKSFLLAVVLGLVLAGCTTIINEAPVEDAALDNSVETSVIVEDAAVTGEDAIEEEDAVENEEDATAEDEEAVEDEESDVSDVSVKSVDDLKLSEKSNIKVGSFDLTIKEEEDSIPKY